MFKLKLIKGRSYMGRGIKATAEKPFVEVDEEASNALIATGRFSLVEELAEAKLGGEGGGKNGEGDEKPIDKMTEKELETYAAENGIDLTGLTKKADKLVKIQEVLAAGDGGNLFNEDN